MHCLCFQCTLTLYPSLIPLIGLCLTTLPFSAFLSLFLSIYFYPSSAVRRITLCLTYTCMFCDANCQFRIFHFCYYCYDHYLDWPSDMVRFFTWSFSIYTMMSSYPHAHSHAHTHVQTASAIQMPVCKLLIQRLRAAMICSYVCALNVYAVFACCVCVCGFYCRLNLVSCISFHFKLKFLFKMPASVRVCVCPHLSSFIREHAVFSLFFLSGVDMCSR